MKCIISFIFLVPILIFSQEKNRFSVAYNDEPLYDVILHIEDVYNVRFSFPDHVILKKRLTLRKGDRTLQEALDEITLKTNLQFEVVNSRYIIIKEVGVDADVDAVEVQQLDDVIIRGYLVKGISKNKDATFQIKPRYLGVLPGLIEPDVLESIQQLPGVISPNETASGLLVRGGASDQNRIIWDGINIYHKGHLFGMISPINANATQDIKFYNKGTNPRFGERISSVIDISSNSHVSNTAKFELGINGVSADAYTEIPIIKDKLSIQGAFRRSYTELFSSYTIEQLTDKVFQSTKIDQTENGTNDFNFMDYNIKINYKLNKNNDVSLSAIQIKNNLDYLVEDLSEDKSFNDLLDIKNDGYGFNWKKRWSPKVKQHTQAFFSKYTLNYNFITKEDGEQISDFEKRNVIFDSGISTEFQINTAEKDIITLGYQYVLKDVSYAFLNITDLSFILDQDQTVITTNSIYGNYQFRNLKWADVNLGLRGAYFSDLNKFRLEPRIQVYKKLSQKFQLQLSGEIKNQVISEIDETVISDLSLENKLWRLADGETFPIINSYQVSAGILFAHNGWSIDVDNYYKKVEGKTALSLGFLNPNDPSFRIGNQCIIGSDIFLKKSFKPFKTWFSYSFNSVENTFEALNNGESFTASTNIKHAFSASVTYQKKQLQLAMGWKWHSGKPFTKSMTDTQGNISFDEGINTGVLPSFHRLDVSATYEFKWSKKHAINSKLGLSIRNVYDRSNLLSREYVSDNDLGNTIRVVDKYSLGFTPNVMFRMYW